eukprot:8253367-Alexandrium_andersonii.AAC.1
MAIGSLPRIQGASQIPGLLVRLDPGGCHRHPPSALQRPSALRPEVRVWEGVDLGAAPESPELPKPPRHGHGV